MPANRHLLQVVSATLGAAAIAATVGQALPPAAGFPISSMIVAATASALTALGLRWLYAKQLKVLLEAQLQRMGGKRSDGVTIPAAVEDSWNRLGARSDAVQEMARGLAENGSRIAVAAAEVSFFADNLKSKVHDEVAEVRNIADTIGRISRTVEEVASIASDAAASARDAYAASDQGIGAVKEANEQMHHTADQAEVTTRLVASLEQKSEQIRDIANVIDDIAAQTNLLALNAAIESARAGEQGRGFAVVAGEVRELAQKTSAATDEIDGSIRTITSEVGTAVSTMQSLGSAVHDSMSRTEKVGVRLDDILKHASNVDQKVAGIATGTEENHAAVDDIAQAVSSVSGHLVETEEHVESVAGQALQLAEMAEFIHEALADFELGTVHDRIRATASQAAVEIGRLFEQAVRDGRLSMEDLFDRDYQPIANTDPQKYSTRFDGFTDQVLPAVQEPILDTHPEIAFAGAVDNNGYFPTHNRRYSQPLTGDYREDLVNNRTKRIFSDRTGSRCGSHTRRFLLQTYKRDTGEVLHDLSVPIYVNGRHWGGFRVGYRAQQ